MNKAEKNISSFYNSGGWDITDGVTEDAKRWEDLRECAQEYVRNCRMRVLRHIPERGQYMLDMASGPIQYPEYLLYSQGYEKRYCVDLSEQALDVARERIGEHGEFLHGSFFDLKFPENFFDCSISLHTIYHMDVDLQEEAVRKLLRITKPGHPVIVIYSNPNSLINAALNAMRKLIRRGDSVEESDRIYFSPHPINWWDRFKDVAEVNVYPWRSFTAKQQKLIFPDNAVGKMLLKCVFWMEDAFPRFFARRFAYPMFVLKKREVE